MTMPNTEHWHHFGSPVYVLDSKLASGKKIDKWSERARVGIYLGRSSQHARTVVLVLSLTTGLTSPQFHIKVDSTFQTMQASFGSQQPASQWQSKCGFTTQGSESLVTPQTGPTTTKTTFEHMLDLDVSGPASEAELPSSEGEGPLPSGRATQHTRRNEGSLPSGGDKPSLRGSLRGSKPSLRGSKSSLRASRGAADRNQ